MSIAINLTDRDTYLLLLCLQSEIFSRKAAYSKIIYIE
jgi:hypothetical protein